MPVLHAPTHAGGASSSSSSSHQGATIAASSASAHGGLYLGVLSPSLSSSSSVPNLLHRSPSVGSFRSVPEAEEQQDGDISSNRLGREHSYGAFLPSFIPGTSDVVEVDVAPTPGQEGLTSKEKSDLRFDVGNMGIYGGNFGGSPKKVDEKRMVDAQLKQNPCHIMCLNEVVQSQEDMLKRPCQGPTPWHDSPWASVQAYTERREFKWCTVRGNGEKANLIAVRFDHTRRPHMTVHVNETHYDGMNRGSNNKTSPAHTRILCVTCHMKQRTGFWGYDVTGINVHLHYATAGKRPGLAKAHTEFWDRLTL